MTDLQCPAVLLLSAAPDTDLSGQPLGPTVETIALPSSPQEAEALLQELEDTRRGESVIVTGPVDQLRAILRERGCGQALPARIEADSDGWRLAAPVEPGKQDERDDDSAPAPSGEPEPERHVALPLAQMTGLQMHAITLLRERVFVVEQKTTAVTEIDDHDALETTTHHWLELDGRPVAVLRVLATGDEISIGRVATAAEHRGRGLAGRLLRLVLEHLGETDRPVVLLGQSHLEQWYERFGFERSGEEVLEVGIPHVPMTLRRGGGSASDLG